MSSAEDSSRHRFGQSLRVDVLMNSLICNKELQRLGINTRGSLGFPSKLLLSTAGHLYVLYSNWLSEFVHEASEHSRWLEVFLPRAHQ